MKRKQIFEQFTALRLSALANCLKDLKWLVYEDLHCMSSSSTLKVDNISKRQQSKRALVLDPTICFERDVTQTEDLGKGNKEIYEQSLPYLSEY